jgi:parvulin-like peptidyl-prolyl isomerase
MSKKKATLSLIVFGLGVVLGLAQQIVEEIVAVVNDGVITLSQYKHEYDLRVQTLRAQFEQAQGQIPQEELDKAMEQLKTGLLDSMITDLLLLQLAKEKNLNVADQVKMTIENIKKENNIESDEDLRRAVQGQGLDWEAWLKQMEESALKQTIVFSEVNRSIVLDDAEVVDYYKKHEKEFIEPEEYTIRAIYLSVEDAAESELEAKKKEIDDKIRGGGDFAELSGLYSDEPLKEAKGDLGTLKKGDLDKTLLQAVESLKKGEISTWVQAKRGWYMLKLEDKKESRLKAFDEAKKTIEEKLYGEKQAVKLDEFLDNLKKRSYIKILKPHPFGN